MPPRQSSKAGPRRSNILVEKGSDPSRLIVAFTGAGLKLTMQPYDFFLTTGMLKHSRILLRDPSRRMYLRGVSPDAPSFGRLLDRLKQEIAELAPETTISVGSSSGTFASILMGHLLKVDEVHAFGPVVHITPWSIIRSGDWRRLRRRQIVRMLKNIVRFRSTLPADVREYSDLRSVLKHWNGRTTYTLHVCENYKLDMKAARYLSSCPHVVVRRYPCKGHNVALHLASHRMLNQIFASSPPS